MSIISILGNELPVCFSVFWFLTGYHILSNYYFVSQ